MFNLRPELDIKPKDPNNLKIASIVKFDAEFDWIRAFNTGDISRVTLKALYEEWQPYFDEA